MGASDPSVSSWPKKRYETWAAFNQSLTMKTRSKDEVLKETFAEEGLLQARRAETKIPAMSAFYEIPQLEPLRAAQSLEIFSGLGSGNLLLPKAADKHQLPPNSKRQRTNKQNGGSRLNTGDKPDKTGNGLSVTIYDKDTALYSSEEKSEESEDWNEPEARPNASVPLSRTTAQLPSAPLTSPALSAPLASRTQTQTQAQAQAQNKFLTPTPQAGLAPSSASKPAIPRPDPSKIKPKVKPESIPSTPKKIPPSSSSSSSGTESKPAVKEPVGPMHGSQSAGAPLTRAIPKVRPESAPSSVGTDRPGQIGGASIRPEGARNATAINRPQIVAPRPPQRPHMSRPPSGSTAPTPALGHQQQIAAPAGPIVALLKRPPETPAKNLKPALDPKPSALAITASPTLSAPAPARPQAAIRPQAPTRPQAPALQQRPALLQPHQLLAPAAGIPAAPAKQLPAATKPGPPPITPVLQAAADKAASAAVLAGSIAQRPLERVQTPPAQKQVGPSSSVDQPPPQPSAAASLQRDIGTVSRTAAASELASKQAATPAPQPSRATVDAGVKGIMGIIDQINAITKAIELLDGSGFDVKSHLIAPKFNSDAQRALVVAKRLFEAAVGDADKV